MNLKEIKQIVNNSILPDSLKEQAIITILSQDKEVIPTIMQILNEERNTNRELLLDTNAELSRALIVLDDANLKFTKKIIADPKWVVGEIKNHYIKWKDYIKCTFKIDGLE